MKDVKNNDWIGDFIYSPMWQGLNNKQQEAVSLKNKNSLILAGAGTGKTKTLVARIAALVIDGEIPTSKILSLTFTNKAACEMKERIESSLDSNIDIEKLTVGTFHSVALDIILGDTKGFGYKKHASVISEFEQRNLVERMFRDRNWTNDSITISKFIEMIKAQGKEKNQTRKRVDPILEFVKLVNQYKEKGLRSKDIARSKIPNFEIFRTMYEAYEGHLKQENSLDFAELLLLFKERLVNDNKFFELYSGKWDIILVDEFQDTNPLQYELLEMLTKKSGAIFAVGDDDQAIYGFRGARVQNIFDFEKECEPEQVIRLEQNYRCSKNILGAANDVIKESSKRLGKELWTDSEYGNLIYTHKLKDNKEEAEFIANSIDTKYRLSGVPPEEIAILYRNNKASIDIEEALMKKGIPYKVVGGLSFMDKKEVKVMLAHAKCLITLNDINALTTAVSFPKSGIGKKRLDNWRNIALEKGVQIEQVIDFFSDPKKEDLKPDLKAFQFLENIKMGRDNIEKLGLKVGLDSYLDAIKYKESFSESSNYSEKLRAIDAVLGALETYEEDGGKLLDEFINGLLMMDTMADDDNEAVWLSTIHASKGLEFSHVYLCGWEDGILPNKRVLSEDETMIDEERRLAYVAITRAKKTLTITFKQAMVHCSPEDNSKILFVEVLTPSRYLSDINPKYLTISYGKSWPPEPAPVNWGKYQGYPTGDQLRRHKLDGTTVSYSPDGTPLTKGSPEFDFKTQTIVKENKTGFLVNDFVMHKRFGVGRIIAIKNEDDLNFAELKVNFINGQEDLLLKHSRLKKINKTDVPNL